MLLCSECGNKQETGLSCQACGSNLIIVTYPININHDKSIVLQEISGVGPIFAQEIINNRPFESVWELKEISGINKDMIKEWKNYICV